MLELSLILAVLLLDFLELGRERLHRPCGAQLPQGEGQREKAHNYDQDNNGNSEATEKGAGEKNEKVKYGLKKDNIPNTHRPKGHQNSDKRNNQEDDDYISSA